MMILRQSLQSAQYARPWQQVLVALALIAGGAGLAFVGHPAGLLASGVGCMFFVRRARLWVARRRGRRAEVKAGSR
ncbi:MAG TPA: hypothetical protein VMV16_05760 [Solirubrobacteraceae bacterium]|nr:hypothetical protein [Solirubrobacteraceae bacterium]